MSCTTCRDHGYITPQARRLPCPDCRICRKCYGSGRTRPEGQMAESEAGMLSTVCPGCGGSGREKR